MGNRGASTTEYVLILLVIGISSILVVRNYGIEIKRLWGGAGEPLGVLDNVFEGESGEIPDYGTGDFETIDEPEGPSEPAGDDDRADDCAERLAAMDQEFEQETARLNAVLASAQAAYDAAMETRRVYRGRRGRWGFGGYWSMEYVHPPEVRQAAENRLNAVQSELNNFQSDWQARYDQLQSECGGD